VEGPFHAGGGATMVEGHQGVVWGVSFLTGVGGRVKVSGIRSGRKFGK